jgi:hypothetical protein
LGRLRDRQALSEEHSGVSTKTVESATVVAGSEKSKDDQLSPALSVEDNGVNEGIAPLRSPSKRLI